jgi:hypothetical protein
LRPQWRGEAEGNEQNNGSENRSSVETDGHGKSPELNSELQACCGILRTITFTCV